MEPNSAQDSPTKDLISVVIPVYNRTVELERAIRSVLNQTWQKFEIIVVDDGSEEPNIKTVCDKFRDHRIHFCRSNIHKNASVARNIGIQIARGMYIALLDSDDEFLPHHLERRLEKIKEWNCDGIFGSVYLMTNGFSAIRISRPLRPGETMINYVLSDGFAPTPSHFYTKKAAQEVKWDETLERHEDYDFSIRFAEKFLFLPDIEPTVAVHHHPLNMRKNISLDSCIEFIRRYEDQIAPQIYNDYHRRLYFTFREHSNRAYVRHYARNSYRYIHLVSFGDFLAVHPVRRALIWAVFLKFIWLHVYYFAKKWLRRMAQRA